MKNAVDFLNALCVSLYNGLKSTQVPVLQVSFLSFLFSVLFLNVCLWVFKAVTGGQQTKEMKGGRLDDNNNYIYRR